MSPELARQMLGVRPPCPWDFGKEISAAARTASWAPETHVVSRAESIRKFVILPDDWTEEAGQLTPSLKLKRNVVVRQHKDEIAALFA